MPGMPTYAARCPECQTDITYLRSVDDRNDTPVCEHDGAKTERVLTAAMTPVMGIADHYKIVSGSGKTFYGRHDYDKHLKSKGLRPSSDLAGEAEHQRKATAVKNKADRRAQLGEIVRKHTA